jgi:hypothetical protein
MLLMKGAPGPLPVLDLPPSSLPVCPPPPSPPLARPTVETLVERRARDARLTHTPSQPSSTTSSPPGSARAAAAAAGGGGGAEGDKGEAAPGPLQRSGSSSSYSSCYGAPRASDSSNSTISSGQGGATTTITTETAAAQLGSGQEPQPQQQQQQQTTSNTPGSAAAAAATAGMAGDAPATGTCDGAGDAGVAAPPAQDQDSSAGATAAPLPPEASSADGDAGAAPVSVAGGGGEEQEEVCDGREALPERPGTPTDSGLTDSGAILSASASPVASLVQRRSVSRVTQPSPGTGDAPGHAPAGAPTPDQKSGAADVPDEQHDQGAHSSSVPASAGAPGVLSLNSKRVVVVTRRHRISDTSDASSSGVFPSSDASMVQGTIPAAAGVAAAGGRRWSIDEDGTVQGWSSDESSSSSSPRAQTGRGHTKPGDTQQPSSNTRDTGLSHSAGQDQGEAQEEQVAGGAAAAAPAGADNPHGQPPPAPAAGGAGPASPAGSEGFSFAAAGCASGSPAGEEEPGEGPPGLLPGAAGQLGGWWGTPENSSSDVGVVPEAVMGQ